MTRPPPRSELSVASQQSGRMTRSEIPYGFCAARSMMMKASPSRAQPSAASRRSAGRSIAPAASTHPGSDAQRSQCVSRKSAAALSGAPTAEGRSAASAVDLKRNPPGPTTLATKSCIQRWKYSEFFAMSRQRERTVARAPPISPFENPESKVQGPRISSTSAAEKLRAFASASRIGSPPASGALFFLKGHMSDEPRAD